MADVTERADDAWEKLKAFTPARIGMRSSGDAIPTNASLQFQMDHAQARDAVTRDVDFAQLQLQGEHALHVRSEAADRAAYIRRPDLGRRLDAASAQRLAAHRATSAPWDAVFVIADGLSSIAVERHAAATLRACRHRLAGWRLAPIVLAAQARVALGDEVGALLDAALSVVLIGERPGLSVPDSLGAYLTWQPRVGRRDAERNCVSNIHDSGLACDVAAEKICWLMREARQRRISGTGLKENAGGQPRISGSSSGRGREAIDVHLE